MLNFVSECIELRDPHCAWDQLKNLCVSMDAVTSFRYLVQDVAKGNASKCKVSTNEKAPRKEYVDSVNDNSIDEERPSPSVKELSLDRDETLFETYDCDNSLNGEVRVGCSQIKRTDFNSGTLWWGIVVAAMMGLLLGFVGGYCVSKKLYLQYPNTPFIEQHNQLDRYVRFFSSLVSSQNTLKCQNNLKHLI